MQRGNNQTPGRGRGRGRGNNPGFDTNRGRGRGTPRGRGGRGRGHTDPQSMQITFPLSMYHCERLLIIEALHIASDPMIHFLVGEGGLRLAAVEGEARVP